MIPKFAKPAEELENKDRMNSEEEPDESSFERFRRLVKRVISVLKSEIDNRAKEWKEARAVEKTEAEE